MKKMIITACAMLPLLSNANTVSNLQPEQLVGNWKCSLDYKDLNLHSEDQVKLEANNKVTDINILSYPINSPIFSYQIESKGKWQLKNNKLIYNFSQKSDVKRLHKPNAQLENNLKAVDTSLYSLITDSSTNYKEPIELVITKWEKNRFNIQQVTPNRVYLGYCVKK